MEFSEGHHIAARLLDPVPPSDPEVEQAVGHVGRNLLGPQDANVVDTRIVNGRPVVDRGTPANPEIGSLEQFEGRFLKRTLRKDEFQHHTNLPVAPPCQTRN